MDEDFFIYTTGEKGYIFAEMQNLRFIYIHSYIKSIAGTIFNNTNTANIKIYVPKDYPNATILGTYIWSIQETNEHYYDLCFALQMSMHWLWKKSDIIDRILALLFSCLPNDDVDKLSEEILEEIYKDIDKSCILRSEQKNHQIRIETSFLKWQWSNGEWDSYPKTNFSDCDAFWEWSGNIPSAPFAMQSNGIKPSIGIRRAVNKRIRTRGKGKTSKVATLPWEMLLNKACDFARFGWIRRLLESIEPFNLRIFKEKLKLAIYSKFFKYSKRGVFMRWASRQLFWGTKVASCRIMMKNQKPTCSMCILYNSGHHVVTATIRILYSLLKKKCVLYDFSNKNDE